MACTVTLQSVVDWARTQVELIPIVGVGGFSDEPALTICNNVLQAMLTRPYAWRFNRKSMTPFDTVDKTQEYTVTSVTDCSWLERAQREQKASTATPKPIFDLDPVRALPKDFIVGIPQKVCIDRESGNDIILRVSPIPGTEVWTIYIDYQAKPIIKTAITQKWEPVPDEFGFIYRQGFLAHCLRYAKDPRALTELQLFNAMCVQATGARDEQENAGFFPERGIMLG